MDQVDKLILRMEGQDKLRQATADMEKQRDVVDKLIKALKGVPAATAPNAQHIRQEAEALKVLQVEVDNLNRSFGRGTSAAARVQGVNNIAYAVQDFVSTSGGMAQKLNSVTNNLQALAVSMGVGGWTFLGITGAVSAVQLFINNFDEISDYFAGIDRAKIEEVAKKAKELEAKGKDIDEALKRIAGEPTADQRQQAGDIVSAGLGQVRGGNGVDRVRDELNRQLTNEDPGTKAARDALKAAQAANASAQAGLKNVDGYTDPEVRAEVETRAAAAAVGLQTALAAMKRALDANRAKAGQMVVDARAGDPAVIAEMARRFPGVAAFQQATPEAMAAADRWAEDQMANTATTPEARRRRAFNQRHADDQWAEEALADTELPPEQRRRRAARAAAERRAEGIEDRRVKSEEARRRRLNGHLGASPTEQMQAPQPTDANEAQMLELERVSLELPAQADAMMGMVTSNTQRLAQVVQRLNLLYTRNRQLMGGGAMSGAEMPTMWPCY